MKRMNVAEMSVAELVENFAAICLEQDYALLYSDISGFNKLYQKMVAVMDELKSRPGDQRGALLALYEHENAQVRLQAARASLALAPALARSLIEVIATSDKFPQAGDAAMTLVNLDRGIFRPT